MVCYDHSRTRKRLSKFTIFEADADDRTGPGKIQHDILVHFECNLIYRDDLKGEIDVTVNEGMEPTKLLLCLSRRHPPLRLTYRRPQLPRIRIVRPNRHTDRFSQSATNTCITAFT